MLRIEKMKPESMKPGSIESSAESWFAVLMDDAMLEMSRPSPRLPSTNSRLASANSQTAPRNGTWNTRIPNAAITTMSITARIAHGVTLPIMSSSRLRGDATSCSIVPSSFSFTSAIAVCWMETPMMRITMRPGMRKYDCLPSGLYQVIPRISMPPIEAVFTPRTCMYCARTLPPYTCVIPVAYPCARCAAFGSEPSTSTATEPRCPPSSALPKPGFTTRTALSSPRLKTPSTWFMAPRYCVTWKKFDRSKALTSWRDAWVLSWSSTAIGMFVTSVESA